MFRLAQGMRPLGYPTEKGAGGLCSFPDSSVQLDVSFGYDLDHTVTSRVLKQVRSTAGWACDRGW